MFILSNKYGFNGAGTSPCAVLPGRIVGRAILRPHVDSISSPVNGISGSGGQKFDRGCIRGIGSYTVPDIFRALFEPATREHFIRAKVSIGSKCTL